MAKVACGCGYRLGETETYLKELGYKVEEQKLALQKVWAYSDRMR